MKRYKTREGIVLTEVCGETLLVSANALRKLCPFVTVLNESSAFLWTQLRNGATVEELESAVHAEYEIDDPSVVRAVIEDFLRQMLELNYLVAEEGESHEE